MRIVFMGTPEFAAASLSRLLSDGHEVCGVFTQPDKPKNRGHKLTASPVKELALSQNIPVYQPRTFRGDEGAEAVDALRALKPDLTVVAAYGKILPATVLDAAPLGTINVHSSLLPRYRGAAPINWAILNGERSTGVSIMYLARELDAGDVILQKRTEIGPDEDALALTARLAVLGAEALSEAVEQIGAGTAVRTPQDHALSCYAPMLSRDLSPVDWNRRAEEIQCQIRGLIPWPCACTDSLNGETVKLYRAAVVNGGTGTKGGATDADSHTSDTDSGTADGRTPGTVLDAGKRGIDILCGGGTVLRILELQSPGGKRMEAPVWLLGHKLNIL
ncbi:MAG: methionyl-tRNA formyltransferase [Oscillibacter sp.]|nr:methionyl-tRNA formyltransferase [Oscillibacter sp.]